MYVRQTPHPHMRMCSGYAFSFPHLGLPPLQFDRLCVEKYVGYDMRLNFDPHPSRINWFILYVIEKKTFLRRPSCQMSMVSILDS